jgi:hypothetical protein
MVGPAVIATDLIQRARAAGIGGWSCTLKTDPHRSRSRDPQ